MVSPDAADFYAHLPHCRGLCFYSSTPVTPRKNTRKHRCPHFFFVDYGSTTSQAFPASGGGREFTAVFSSATRRDETSLKLLRLVKLFPAETSQRRVTLGTSALSIVGKTGCIPLLAPTRLSVFKPSLLQKKWTPSSSPSDRRRTRGIAARYLLSPPNWNVCIASGDQPNWGVSVSYHRVFFLESDSDLGLDLGVWLSFNAYSPAMASMTAMPRAR